MDELEEKWDKKAEEEKMAKEFDELEKKRLNNEAPIMFEDWNKQ